MNEIINEVPEVIETAVESAGRYGPKRVVIGFFVGLGTGIAGTRLAKSVKGELQVRKDQKFEARFHRIKKDEEDDDIEIVATDD